MSSRWVLTPAARDDLLDIRRYVRRRFGRAEDQKIRERFLAVFGLLAEQPRRGRRRPEF